MCFGLFRKRKDYIKNSKKYIEKKFNFLSENGYKYHYFFCNGEETFSFCNNVVAFEIYHDIYPFAFDIVLRDGAVSFDEIFDGRAKVKRKNVNEILSNNWEDIKSTLSPIEIVDYYAELVANNLNILEKAFK
jgi:hypothetical protein